MDPEGPDHGHIGWNRRNHLTSETICCATPQNWSSYIHLLLKICYLKDFWQPPTPSWISKALPRGTWCENSPTLLPPHNNWGNFLTNNMSPKKDSVPDWEGTCSSCCRCTLYMVTWLLPHFVHTHCIPKEPIKYVLSLSRVYRILPPWKLPLLGSCVYFIHHSLHSGKQT